MQQKTMTKEIAVSLADGSIIYSKDFNNADGTPARYRVNGKCKVWKKSPERFQLPVKRGLREYGYITEANMQFFYIED